MKSLWQVSHSAPRHLWPLLIGAVGLAIVTGWLISHKPDITPAGTAEDSIPAGPPWRYGRLDARFTLVEYADLECPYCQAYFPVLKGWIDTNPEVNWQWHHLPLPMHEPAATRGARLAECAGEVGGRTAFWNSIAWVYQHTRSGGHGLPSGAQLPDTTPALQACLASTRPDAVIRTQAEEAMQAGIAATPTLRVVDNQTGTSLLLPAGPLEGDALLSAIDLLSSSGSESPTEDTDIENLDMPADLVGDMPR